MLHVSIFHCLLHLLKNLSRCEYHHVLLTGSDDYHQRGHAMHCSSGSHCSFPSSTGEKDAIRGRWLDNSARLGTYIQVHKPKIFSYLIKSDHNDRRLHRLHLRYNTSWCRSTPHLIGTSHRGRLLQSKLFSLRPKFLIILTYEYSFCTPTLSWITLHLESSKYQ